MAQPQTAQSAGLEIGDLPQPLYRVFTDCPEGWFIVKTRGSDWDKIIHSVRGWYVGEDFIFRPETKTHKNETTLLRWATGHEFVGVPGIHGLKVTPFAWNKYWRKDAGSTVYQAMAHKAELVYKIPFESQYPLTFEGIDVVADDRVVDDEEATVPIEVVVNVRVRMRRPKVALANNVDWFGGVLVPKMQAAIKSFSGPKTYADMVRGNKDTLINELRTYILGTSRTQNPSNLIREILRFGGVETLSFDLVDVKPNPTFEEILLKLANAQKQAKADVVLSEARMQVVINEGIAEAKKIRSISEAEEDRLTRTVLKLHRAGVDANQYTKWASLGSKDSKIVTYVEGGATTQTSILIGPDGKPLRQAA